MPVSSSGSWAGPFGYGGKFGYQSDPDSGLMLLGHRYYDPSTGRFLTRDPIQDGRNWYAYCGNNPISFADPSGLAKRVLSDEQRHQVQSAIEVIRKVDPAAASHLENLLNSGLIYVEDEMAVGEWGRTTFPVFGNQEIHLSPALFRDPDDPRYSLRRWGNLNEWGDEIWLAGILYHEYIHTQQSFFWRSEVEAWTATAEFFTKIAKRNSGNWRKRAEDLAERAQNVLGGSVLDPRFAQTWW